MPAMNMVQALNSAMDVMLARDPSVVLLGEDIGYFGGVFRVTDGLQKKYGAHRVLDTPIAEGGIVGASIGMAVNGLRPVAEIQFAAGATSAQPVHEQAPAYKTWAEARSGIAALDLRPLHPTGLLLPKLHCLESNDAGGEVSLRITERVNSCQRQESPCSSLNFVLC